MLRSVDWYLVTDVLGDLLIPSSRSKDFIYTAV